MTDRERFYALFKGEKVDRIPVYFFGTWRETKERWKNEGLVGKINMESDYGPYVEGMDADWEEGMWDCHQLVDSSLYCEGQNEVIEDTEDHTIIKYATGSIVQYSKGGSSFAHAIKEILSPTRESWEKVKEYYNARDPRRYTSDWEAKARSLSKRNRIATFMCGSLYGHLRALLGVEELSVLMYEDPELLDEMVGYFADYFMELFGPVAKLAKFDFGYIFEDCCGAEGPLFSPEIYRKIFDKHYRRLIDFYKNECGIPFILLDSDGKIDPLVPCWLESGVDILFPIEVGKWKASPVEIRKQFGSNVGMMGGIDKHLIAQGGEELYQHLTELKPAVDQGRYLPIPDHRIPPDVSLEVFKKYIQTFNDVFNK